MAEQLHRRSSKATLLVLIALATVAIASCDKSPDPFTPGADVNADADSVFATLMRRPDIDQAATQYEQMGTELRAALSRGIPDLDHWQKDGDTSNSACGSDYPGINFDGQTRDLPDYVVSGNLADDKYEQALKIIAPIAQKYAFDPNPQRLLDKPGDHEAIFHNVHDDGSITFGTAKNTLLGLSLGCHLTAASKQRGHLSP